MKQIVLLAAILFSYAIYTFGQTIKRIDGSKITADSLDAKIKNILK